MTSLRSMAEAYCPRFLRGIWAQIESSPLGTRLASGAFWSLSISMVSKGLGVISAILVGRLLGKVEYGELGLIQNTIGMFGTLAGFGMGLTVNKHVAEFKKTDSLRAGRKSVEISDDYDCILFGTHHEEYRSFEFSTFKCPLVDTSACVFKGPKKYYRA